MSSLEQNISVISQQPKMDNINNLATLNQNQVAIIDRIVTTSEQEFLKTRLQAMGIVAGEEVKVLRKFWFGGPIQVQVGQMTTIAIRRSEAQQIMVKIQNSEL